MNEEQRIIEEFRRDISPYFARVKEQLAESLERIMRFPYPDTVRCLSFDIFPESFAFESPLYLYLLDGGNDECFLEGEDFSRNVMDVDGIYPAEFEAVFSVRHPEFNLWEHASNTLTDAFSECFDFSTWKKNIDVLIGINDSSERYDLVNKKWLRL